MTTISKQALALVLPQYKLDHKSRIHGIPHWANVSAIGLKLCSELKLTGEALDVVQWFAYLHDACRVNDDADPGHGMRAAAFARQCWATEDIKMSEAYFQMLCEALSGHSLGYRYGRHLVVNVCWDADRLELPRVDIIPDPARMCTEPGKRIAVDWQRIDKAVNSKAHSKRVSRPSV